MQINLPIKPLLSIRNIEAVTLVAIIHCLKTLESPTLLDYSRVSNFCSQTVTTHLKHFTELGLFTVKQIKNVNKYFYIEPTERYITIDTSVLDINVNKVTIGTSIRLKTYSRINSNYVDASGVTLQKELNFSSIFLHKAVKNKIIARNETKTRIEFIHPSLTIY